MAAALLAVVGSANVDLVFRTARFPAPGETVLGHGFATFLGGKGANQAVAAARLGAEVAFVGKVGDDLYGVQLVEGLAKEGIDTHNVLRAESTPSGVAGITVQDSGENCIVVAPGSNALLYGEEVAAALKEMRPAAVVCQFEISDEAVLGCRGPWSFLVNPAPVRSLPAGLGADVLTPNRTEAEALTGVRPVDEATCAVCAGKLLATGASHVVITVGELGCFLANRDRGVLLPTLSVKPVDTTGAGDAFNGALAAFLLEGRDIQNAALLANAAAAISTTRPGAQASMATRAELAELAGELL